MPIKQVFLDIQHAGQSHKQYDKGATYNNELYESDLCLEHAQWIRDKLHRMEIPTYLLTFGRYSLRHKLVNDFTENPHETLYIALHLNSHQNPSANYTLFEYCKGSMDQTVTIASLLSKYAVDIIGLKLPDKTFAPDGIRMLRPGERGHACIDGVHGSSILSELLFISNPEHLDIALHKKSEIARIYSSAIEEFNKS
jgi:N-acetylmuramoyl-L-alanine amidase